MIDLLGWLPSIGQGVAFLAAAAGVVWGLVRLVGSGRRAGRAEVERDVARSTAEARRRMERARAGQGDRDVVDRLRDGGL